MKEVLCCSVCIIVKQFWDMKILIQQIIFPTLPKPLEHEFFCWIHSVFFFSAFYRHNLVQCYWQILQEGKMRRGCLYSISHARRKEGTVTQKGQGRHVDETTENCLHLALSQTHTMWCCFSHKLKGVCEFAKVLIILFDTSFDYLNYLCQNWKNFIWYIYALEGILERSGNIND